MVSEMLELWVSKALAEKVLLFESATSRMVQRQQRSVGEPSESVTVHLLYHGIFLFSVLRRTRLLFGMYSYNWIHTLILLSSLNSSFIEL